MLDLSTNRLAPLTNLPPTSSGVSLSTAPAISRFIYRGTAGAPLAGDAFGVTLPTAPCSSAIAGDHAVLWLGPDEWLLFAPETETAAVQRTLTDALADIPHALVDISHRH